MSLENSSSSLHVGAGFSERCLPIGHQFQATFGVWVCGSFRLKPILFIRPNGQESLLNRPFDQQRRWSAPVAYGLEQTLGSFERAPQSGGDGNGRSKRGFAQHSQ